MSALSLTGAGPSIGESQPTEAKSANRLKTRKREGLSYTVSPPWATVLGHMGHDGAFFSMSQVQMQKVQKVWPQGVLTGSMTC